MHYRIVLDRLLPLHSKKRPIFGIQNQFNMKTKVFFLGLCCFAFVACSSKTESGSAETNADAPTKTEGTTTEAAAPGRYKAGDILYCYAKSGLVLRDKPDQAGAKVASVPLTGKVEIKDEAPFQQAFSVKEACGLEIKGFWVKASFGGKEGYIFDGYLLKQRFLGMEETTVDYWSSMSKLKSSTDKPPKDDVNYYAYTKASWENGIEYENAGYEGGATSTLILPKSVFSFQEAYLLGLSDLQAGPDNPYKCTCDAAKQTAECSSKDELAVTTVEVDANGNYVITDSYAD
jgi:hypothetical protein